MSETLTKALAELRGSDVVSEVKDLIDKEVPALNIVNALQQGMQVVGNRFEAEEYFLSELIMSAHIFNNAIALLGESFSSSNNATYGTFVLGTVYGDIHDIGKDIVKTVLSCNGFNVIDLGVDVAPEKFVKAIKEYKPELVGLSCLLTNTFDSMKRTVQEITEAGLRKQVKIIIGGGPIDQSVGDYVGADAVCYNAQEAVETSKKLLGVK